MTGRVRRVLVAAACLGIVTACGGGTTSWVDYLKDQGVVDPQQGGYGEAVYEATRTGYEMCRLMRDDDMTVPMVVASYPDADPGVVETLAAGADAHLCDSV